MRLGVSGAHGTGKSTFVADLSDRLPGHIAVVEPYEALEDEGHEFPFPPTAGDYRLQLKRSIDHLRLPGERLIFDRTPLDFLAYLAVLGCAPDQEGSTDELSPLFASLDALILLPMTTEVRELLPTPDLPQLAQAVDDALLNLAFCDPLDAWTEVPILQLDGPVDKRVETATRLLGGLSATR